MKTFGQAVAFARISMHYKTKEERCGLVMGMLNII